MAIMHMLREDAYQVPTFHTGKEFILYDALESKLPSDYHVFYSVNFINNLIFDNEADFIIFHPKKGFLVIEAKSGNDITYKNNCWYYSNNVKMNPFSQVRRIKHNLIDKIKDKNPDIANNSIFTACVWFHEMDKDAVNTNNLPLEVDEHLLLTSEALLEPEIYINKIFSKIDKKSNLNSSQTKFVINLLDPKISIKATKQAILNYNKYLFDKYTFEQSIILNFLQEQNSAVINGAAGTGKTFVALKRATECAINKEKVLYLCFNKNLCNILIENNSYPDFINFKTIHRLAAEKNAIKNNEDCDFNKLKDILIEEANNSDFEYKHIIIDEGQDFGREEFEETNIIQTLSDIMEKINGTFFIFYDKNQIIQSKNIPKYILDADSKITLYKNCRNTMNIAISSSMVIEKLKPSGIELKNELKPIISINKDKKIKKDMIDNAIKLLKEKLSNNIVILTCLPQMKKENSFLYEYTNADKYKGYPFFSVNVFKGLEADAIILIDIEKRHFVNEIDKLTYYTGTSRARYGLVCICNLDEKDCSDILDFYNTKYNKKTKRSIKTIFAENFNFETLNV